MHTSRLLRTHDAKPRRGLGTHARTTGGSGMAASTPSAVCTSHEAKLQAESLAMPCQVVTHPLTLLLIFITAPLPSYLRSAARRASMSSAGSASCCLAASGWLVPMPMLSKPSLSARPCSSATIWMSESTSSCGVAVDVVLSMAFSMYSLRTSRSSNCFSNSSMVLLIFSRFMLFMARPMPLTTLFMLCETCCMRTAVSTRADTASILLLSRRKFCCCDFSRMAFCA
mmetsp:Transcript_25048/g.78534  ORF Transcript_25048/g.78534 Transcript_25048/m.78534 type:complete len:227 (-) Transcript_25048:385-1065(-)